MTSAVYDRTPNLGLGLIEFNFPNWADDANINMKIIDAVMQYIGVSIRGVWENNTAYTKGEVVLDADTNTLWRAAESHVSSPTGTMAEERIAFPARWIDVTVILHARGEWTPDTVYYPGDVVYYGNYVGIVTAHYTSSDTFQQDVDDGNIVVLTNTTHTVQISDTPPVGPLIGHLWWESDSGSLYVWYDDGDSAQWVEIASAGPVGADGKGIYDTTLGVAAETVPDTMLSIQTSGYATPGDGGGALFKRVGGEPTHIGKVQSLDGAWWELAETVIDLAMLGGGTGNATADTAAFQGAINMLDGATDRGRLRLPPGNTSINATLNIALGRFDIVGHGMGVSRITSSVVGAPTFRGTGNILNMYIADFHCQGNLLTGASGNGHCFALATVSLPYDGQTVNFTNDQVITGATSGATATILSHTDTGTAGVLTLQSQTGTFVDNEVITDALGGTALANCVNPALNMGAAVPQAVTYERVSVDGFRGDATEGINNTDPAVEKACAFNIKGALGCVIRDVVVQNCGAGIYTGWTQNCLIDNPTISFCDAFGIFDYRSASLRILGGDVQMCCLDGADLISSVPPVLCANLVGYLSNGTILSGTKTKNATANAQVYYHDCYGPVIEKLWVQTTMSANVPHIGIMVYQCTSFVVRDCEIGLTSTAFAQPHTGIEVINKTNTPTGGVVSSNHIQFTSGISIRACIAITGDSAARAFNSVCIEHNVIGSRQSPGTVTVDDAILVQLCTMRECRIANNLIHAASNVTITRGIRWLTVTNGGRNKIKDNTMTVGAGTGVITTPYTGTPVDYVVISTTTGAINLTPGVTARYIRCTGLMTGNLTLTPLTTGAFAGDTFRVSRTGGDSGGPWSVIVSGKNLALNTWCDTVFDGTAWYVAGYGAL